MPDVAANGIRIEYDTFGDRSSPALLLIAGNGAQLIFWEVEFCELLAATGLFVIRFDNRDAGLSTKFDEAGVPDLMAAFQAAMQGEPVESAYSLDDMADDAVGLLDALGIAKAHICGLSMGGMVAQVVAYRHPDRVLSLTSIMSNTGNPNAPQGKPEALAAVVAPPPEEREAYIAHNLKVWRQIWSPGFPFEDERARTFLENSYDRCHYPQGMARQNMAILANGDRRPLLSSIKAPTLVIHGADDPLIPVEAGKEAARVIPGAGLLIIDGMGHDLPQGAWAQIAAAISRHTKRAGL
ncbi:MAG: alpha/beta fold hydrolase [Desulfarculaceae bacterium]|nr:alpha/beta fold hydrolase [Desulfarculaceae bacterium]MCF8049041.1 alpha/beta fold hydrolase [Desulfarculaceae bacterium]MCF8064995.1 alpha/beta fold hydrolase [Desulfarculaceae bacterium]MCF8097551.1 alpha/beta fold hydrolase [Desulfarculaceae bacterium]MCF8122202.1 alpha/beta fold hydrolase [Desulfarculaceae bacterium]